MSDVKLTEPQVRVLGVLIEKQWTTPLGYPMTPNGVRVACNQKSNRDPVVEFDDDLVFDTLKGLERLGYVTSGLLDGTQTVKYKHLVPQVHGLEKGEVVILCELFNRGPQTPGELRSRCDRMYHFEGLADVERCLGHLVDKKLVTMLERQPGTKEHRWAHLLSGSPRIPTPNPAAVPRQALEERVGALEAQVQSLEARLARLEGR